ncbi:hypothetical protein [Leptospira alexanderi]|uniref:hypothetical protein n=1 Tax=Leptospira alexanderi TaxID=100053 RepID=UPI0009912A85|nr:hypothetical protein [Leptospira alexanderi]
MYSRIWSQVNLFLWRIRATRFSSKTLIDKERWRLAIRNHWSHWFNGFPLFTLSFEKGIREGSSLTLNAGLLGLVFVLFIYSKTSIDSPGRKEWKQI